jgi:hypothetical protein
VDSFEEEQERLSQLANATTLEARLALRALFHRIIERIDIFTAGLLDVPDDFKTTVFPNRYGMDCYAISLVGSYKMWIWWDGTQLWEEGNAQPWRRTRRVVGGQELAPAHPHEPD